MQYYFIITSILISVYLLWSFLFLRKRRFFGIRTKDLGERIGHDLKKTANLVSKLDETMKEIEVDSHNYSYKNFDNIKEKDRQNIKELWVLFFDYYTSLGIILDDYKYFNQINFYTNKKLNAKAFLIAYASFLSIHRSSVRLLNLVSEYEFFEKIFSDEYLELGIGVDFFKNLKRNTYNSNDMTWLMTGCINFKYLGEHYSKHKPSREMDILLKFIKSMHDNIISDIEAKKVARYGEKTIKAFKAKTYKIWFPFQRLILGVAGRIRLSSRKNNLITKKQLRKMKKKMRIGDLMLQRRNWYVCNLGIPGFWPHAVIYIGKYSQFKNFFSDPLVKEYLEGQGYNNISKWMQAKYPKFKDDYILSQNEVIEVRAPGVIIQTFNDSALADYVGVVRPRLSKLELFKSIEYTFSQYGKPYDYHFDFVTDSAFICSELVYKAFKDFLNLNTKTVAGKKIFITTQLVEKFDKEYNKKNQELDFVYFLEGVEKEGRARVGSIEEFRKTWQKSKWDMRQI